MIAQGYGWPDSPRPQEVTAMPCVKTPLRKEEEIIKVHTLNMKYMSTN